MDTTLIENLVRWSAPKERQTKYGPRLLRTAEATPEFWDAWRSKKETLKAAGVSCSRDERTGEWQATWWQELPAEVVQARADSIEQSRALSADIDLPHPEGLDYMPFQKAAIKYALERTGVLIGDEMGCIDGDAEIIVNRAGAGRRITLRNLYNKFHGDRWDLNIPTRTRSLNEETGELRLNEIIDVIDKGKREVVELITEGGKNLFLTPDHEVFTNHGWQEAGSLESGDTIYVNGKLKCLRCGSFENVSTYEYAKFKGYCRDCIYKYLRNDSFGKTESVHLDTDGYVQVGKLWNHPFVSRHGSVLQHRLVIEANMNGLSYETWIKIIQSPDTKWGNWIILSSNVVVHHKDGNKQNNALENLEVMSCEDHMRLHSSPNRLTEFMVTKEDRIKSVRRGVRRDVYDIVMASPYHSFAANGIIVHNCGKTIEAIGIINAKPEIKTAVIVCPKSLKLNWRNELFRWLTRDLSYKVINGGWEDANIVILNYEGAVKYQEQLKARVWDAVILDECHLAKNAKAKRSIAVKSIPARMKIRMTGTPIVNRPAELYNIIEDLGGNWGSFFSFAKRYCNATHNGYGWDFSGASNLDELQKRLRETVMIRRLKSDVLTELPRKIRQVIELEPETAGQRQAVKAEKAHETGSDARLEELRLAVELSKAESEEAYQRAVEELRDASRVEFTEMARLRHETAIAKIPLVVDFIRAALEDDDEKKIIVAAHHHDMIDGLANGLLDFYPVVLTGETSETDRQKAVEKFQNEKRVRVFIGSIQAAGVGITLTASSHVIFSELDWVPGNVTQMEDRAHRIGQTETVLVQHLVLAESIDAHMAKTIIGKQAVIDRALDVKHPEHKHPVYEPRVQAATAEARPDAIAQAAEKLSSEDIAIIQAGLRQLAGLDWDHASERNDVGFNRLDVRIGHSLAQAASLTPKQAALGAKLLRKYHRQLSDEVNQVVQKAGGA